MTYETATATCNVNYWVMPITVGKRMNADCFITAQDVINAGCTAFNVTKLDLISESRKREIIKARFITMYVMRLKVKIRAKRYGTRAISYKQIGKLFNRDHATVMKALERIEDDLTVPAYRQETNELIMSVIKYL